MANVQVKLSISAIRELLKSAVVQDQVDEAGRMLLAAIDPKYLDDFEYVRGRSKSPFTSRGFVQAVNARGMRAEAKNKTLTRAVGTMRGR